MTEPIEGVAQVVKIQTLVDNGIRWTFDIPETDIYQSAAMMELKRSGIAFRYSIVPIVIDGDDNQPNSWGR